MAVEKFKLVAALNQFEQETRHAVWCALVQPDGGPVECSCDYKERLRSKIAAFIEFMKTQ